MRRVETVRFVDTATLERRVTLDVDGAHLRAVLQELTGDTEGSLLLPIAVLAKRLALDIDVRDASGAAIPVIPRVQDAEASQAAILAQLAEEGYDPGTLSKAIRKTLYEAAYAFPSERDVEGLLDPAAGENPIAAWELITDLSGDEDDEVLWAQLLEEYQSVEDLLVNFTLNFMLMVRLPVDQDVLLIKYRYVEAVTDPAVPVFAERLGLVDFANVIVAPGVGTARSEHFRMEAPPGLFFTFVDLWRDAGNLEAGRRRRPAGARASFRRRLTRSRVAIYTAGLRPGPYQVVYRLRPMVRGFLRTARLSLLGSLVLLTAGGVAQLLDCRLSPPAGSAQADAATAILLLVPSIFAGYLAREGEHELLSEMLRWPRLAVAAAGFSGLVAGGALVLDVSGRALAWVWLTCAAVCAFVAALLTVIIRRSAVAIAQVDANAEQGDEEEVLELAID